MNTPSSGSSVRDKRYTLGGIASCINVDRLCRWIDGIKTEWAVLRRWTGSNVRSLRHSGIQKTMQSMVNCRRVSTLATLYFLSLTALSIS